MLNKRLRDLQQMLEKRMWVLDTLLVVILVKLTYFCKPFWCAKRAPVMTEDCQMDVFGNKYHLISALMTLEADTFFYSFAILTYFNIKFYMVFMFMKQSRNVATFDRKLKLSLTTLINILHVFFYFLSKEDVVRVDGCSLMRMCFLLVQM